MHSLVLVRSILFGLASLLFLASPCFATEIGKVITLVPGVAVERGGQRIPLALKGSIELHDTIVSDATGKAQIIFADDSTVTIGNNARLSMEAFAASGSKPVFKARLGQGLARIITGKVVEQNPDGFSIATPEATVGIRGTVLAVRSEQGRTSVFVENTLHKEVFVNSTLVPQGFKAIVSAPGATPVPEAITPQDQKGIEQESTVAKAAPQEDAAAASLAALPGTMGPETALADVNLGQQNLGDNAQPLGTASVSGSLTNTNLPNAPTPMSGTFGFMVNLGSGSISGATMSAFGLVGGDADGGIGLGPALGTGYNLAGGSGQLSGNNFSISGFSGNGVAVGAFPPGSDVVWRGTALGAGPASMTGTLHNSGGGVQVNGNYSVDVGGWGTDSGSFSGSGTISNP